MKRSKEPKTKKLTKDLKVSEETVKKVKGGLSQSTHKFSCQKY